MVVSHSLRGEADFFEGNRGGGPIYPRSGMREHTAQSLCYIATAIASNSGSLLHHRIAAGEEEDDETFLGPLVADLSTLLAADSNRFSYGWASEALRRLAACSPFAADAFESFLQSGRWKPAQMQMELQIQQAEYGGDPLMPTLFAP